MPSRGQHHLLNAHLCGHLFIGRAPVTAIGGRQARGSLKKPEVMLQGRSPLVLVGRVADRHFVSAHDAVFHFVDAHQATELIGLMRLAFADDYRVRLEQAQDLLGVMPVIRENPRARLRENPIPTNGR